MEPGEIVESTRSRFLHLINKLENLKKKTFSNKDFANKISRFMCREWQLRVTAIQESNGLNNLDITILFENEISDLNSVLNSLKEEHASLVSEKFNVYDTLAEKAVKIDCNTYPILKLKNENLKGQLS